MLKVTIFLEPPNKFISFFAQNSSNNKNCVSNLIIDFSITDG